MTAEAHEIAYVIMGSGGVYLTFVVFGMRARDLWWLHHTYDDQGRRVNGFRRRLAIERLLSCFGWFVFTLLMLAAGVLALSLPPVEPTTPRLIWRALFFGGVIYSTLLALFQVDIRQYSAHPASKDVK